jgi:5,10-methylenetetrahydromethanopterin reductase
MKVTNRKVRLSITGSSIAPGPQGSLSEQLTFLRDLEDMGLLHLVGGGSADSQSGVYAAMGLVAEHTRTAKVGPLVDNPYTRLPTVAAGEISMIQYISGGRAFFCLGTGGGQARAALQQMGLAPAKMAELREYAGAVKGLCAGQEVEYHGRRLKILGHRTPSNVPLYLDASGPQSMRLVGEIGDGAIIPFGVGRDAVAQLKSAIANGADRAGRDPNTIDCWWFPAVMLGKSEAEALDRVKFYLAMRTKSVMSYASLKGVPDHLHEPIKAFRKEYVAAEHGRPDLKTNGALLDKYRLTAWAADRQAIIGPPERIVERIQEISSWGVTNITFPLWEPTFDQRRQTARIFAERVVPYVS